SEPIKPEPGDDAERKLMKERYNAALVILEVRLDRERVARGLASEFEDALNQVLRAKKELVDKADELIPLLELRLELAREVEKATEAVVELKGGSADILAAARIARISSELELLRTKKKAGVAKP